MNARLLDIAFTALESRKENRALVLRRAAAVTIESFSDMECLQEELDQATHVYKRQILEAFRTGDTLEIGKIFERAIFNYADRITELMDPEPTDRRGQDEVDADMAGKPLTGEL